MSSPRLLSDSSIQQTVVFLLCEVCKCDRASISVTFRIQHRTRGAMHAQRHDVRVTQLSACNRSWWYCAVTAAAAAADSAALSTIGHRSFCPAHSDARTWQSSSEEIRVQMLNSDCRQWTEWQTCSIFQAMLHFINRVTTLEVVQKFYTFPATRGIIYCT